MLESRAKSDEDREILVAFSNLSLTTAETATAYAIAQAVQSRCNLRNDICVNAKGEQATLLASSIISRDLFPTAVIKSVGSKCPFLSF